MSVTCMPGRTYSRESCFSRRRWAPDISGASRRGEYASMSSPRGRSNTVMLKRSSEARMPCSSVM